MAGFRFVLPLLAGTLFAGAAQAVPTVSAVFNNAAAYDAHLLGLGLNAANDRQAVAIARVGNNTAATTGFNGGWEAAVFVPFVDGPVFANGLGTPGNFVWPSHAVNMTLTRVGGNMTFTVGGYSQAFTFANAGLVDTLGLQLGSQTPGVGAPPAPNSASWGPLTLTSLAGGIATQTAANGAAAFQVVTGITGDFTLAGTITLAFDPADRPGASQLAFRIGAFATSLGTADVIPVPVPAALAMFGLGLLALGGIVARRRA